MTWATDSCNHETDYLFSPSPPRTPPSAEGCACHLSPKPGAVVPEPSLAHQQESHLDPVRNWNSQPHPARPRGQGQHPALNKPRSSRWVLPPPPSLRYCLQPAQPTCSATTAARPAPALMGPPVTLSMGSAAVALAGQGPHACRVSPDQESGASCHACPSLGRGG